MTFSSDPKTTVGGVAALLSAAVSAMMSYAHGAPIDWTVIGPLLGVAWVGITAADAKK
jgi:hypothetical protein